MWGLCLSVAARICDHEWHVLVLWCCEWLVSCVVWQYGSVLGTGRKAPACLWRVAERSCILPDGGGNGWRAGSRRAHSTAMAHRREERGLAKLAPFRPCPQMGAASEEYRYVLLLSFSPTALSRQEVLRAAELGAHSTGIFGKLFPSLRVASQ